MRNANIDTLSTIRVFAIFFGTIIGAGFASGREIYVYFARFGGWGMLATFLGGILFFLFGYMFLQLGRRVKVETMSEFLSLTFGKFAKPVEFVIAITYLVVIGAMFAGFDSIQKILMPTDNAFPFLQIISVAVCVLVTFGGIENITKINFLLLPAIIIFILVIFTSSIINKEQSIAFILFDSSLFSIISPFICCMIFVCSNMFLTGFILLKTGAHSNEKNDKKASALTGITMFVITFFSYFSIALNPSCINFDMPFLFLSFKVSDAFVYFSVIVLWFAIFTSAVASLYTLSWCINGYIKKPKTSIILTALIGYLVSKIGFSAIIDVLYPLTGVMDILFVLSSIILFYRLNKKSSKKLFPYSRVDLSRKNRTRFLKIK